MIRCTKCQTINPDDAMFCSNCASFLEWTGEKVEPAAVEQKVTDQPATAGPAPDQAQAAEAVAAAAELATAPASAELPAEAPAAEEPEAPAAKESEAPAAKESEEPPDDVARAETAEIAVADEPAEVAAVDHPAQVAAADEPAEEPAADEPAEEPAADEPPPPPPPTGKATGTDEDEPHRLPWPPPPPPPPPFGRKAEDAIAEASPPAAFDRVIPVPPELLVADQPSEPVSVAPTAERPKPTFRFRATPAEADAPAGGDAPATARSVVADTPVSDTPSSARPSLVADEPVPRRPFPTQDEPAARRPTAEVVARPRPRPVQTLSTEPAAKPGDLICAVCGTANDPQRRFCRHCGNSLATAVIARKPPWYRRLFARNQRAFVAGQRPRGMGEAGQPRRSVVRPIILLTLIGLLVVLIGGYLIDSPVKGAVDGAVARVGRMIDTYNHPGSKAFDGDFGTFWLADSSGDTPSANVNLKTAGDVTSIEFHSGSSIGPEFGQYRRPKTVSLQFASGEPVEITLVDDPAAQDFSVEATAVAAFKLTIVDYYDADDPSQELVALREVIVTETAP